MIRYMDMTAVGDLFGVDRRTVTVWRARYAETHPCPAPDAMTGQTPGWLPERAGEWRTWEASRPGRGAGGGRPRKSQPE